MGSHTKHVAVGSGHGISIRHTRGHMLQHDHGNSGLLQTQWSRGPEPACIADAACWGQSCLGAKVLLKRTQGTCQENQGPDCRTRDPHSSILFSESVRVRECVRERYEIASKNSEILYDHCHELNVCAWSR